MLVVDVRVDEPLGAGDVLTLVGAGRNDDAVATEPQPGSPAATWRWSELYDQTGASEDMSFMLFTVPELCDGTKTSVDLTGPDEPADDKKDPAVPGDSKK